MSDSVVQSVERVGRVLELLAEKSPLTVTEIAADLGVHKSTASRLLTALRHASLVEPAAGARGGYQLGSALVRLASAVTSRQPTREAAQHLVALTVDDLDLTANVAILDGIHAVNIAQRNSATGVFTMRDYVGLRTPGHATSTGKMLLAHAPAETIAQAATALTQHTDRTLTTEASLRAELDQVRAQGWSCSDQEWEPGVTAVAVPLRLHDGTVEASLSVTAPVHLLPPENFESVAASLHRLVGRSDRWVSNT